MFFPNLNRFLIFGTIASLIFSTSKISARHLTQPETQKSPDQLWYEQQLLQFERAIDRAASQCKQTILPQIPDILAALDRPHFSIITAASLLEDISNFEKSNAEIAQDLTLKILDTTAIALSSLIDKEAEKTSADKNDIESSIEGIAVESLDQVVQLLLQYQADPLFQSVFSQFKKIYLQLLSQVENGDGNPPLFKVLYALSPLDEEKGSLPTFNRLKNQFSSTTDDFAFIASLNLLISQLMFENNDQNSLTDPTKPERLNQLIFTFTGMSRAAFDELLRARIPKLNPIAMNQFYPRNNAAHFEALFQIRFEELNQKFSDHHETVFKKENDPETPFSKKIPVFDPGKPLLTKAAIQRISSCLAGSKDELFKSCTHDEIMGAISNPALTKDDREKMISQYEGHLIDLYSNPYAQASQKLTELFPWMTDFSATLKFVRGMLDSSADKRSIQAKIEDAFYSERVSAADPNNSLEKFFLKKAWDSIAERNPEKIDSLEIKNLQNELSELIKDQLKSLQPEALDILHDGVMLINRLDPTEKNPIFSSASTLNSAALSHFITRAVPTLESEKKQGLYAGRIVLIPNDQAPTRLLDELEYLSSSTKRILAQTNACVEILNRAKNLPPSKEEKTLLHVDEKDPAFFSMSRGVITYKMSSPSMHFSILYSTKDTKLPIIPLYSTLPFLKAPQSSQELQLRFSVSSQAQPSSRFLVRAISVSLKTIQRQGARFSDEFLSQIKPKVIREIQDRLKAFERGSEVLFQADQCGINAQGDRVPVYVSLFEKRPHGNPIPTSIRYSMRCTQLGDLELINWPEH